MENSNLILLLKTFSKNEMKEFDKFLRSPYFTEGKNIRHKILQNYFLELKEFYPEFTAKQFNKESIYIKLYPGTKYNDGIMRKLNSDLTKLAERFLIQIESEKDDFKQREFLIKNLGPRKLDKIFMKKSAECYSFLNENPFELYYHFNHQLIDILVNNFSVFRQRLSNLYNPRKGIDNFFLYFISRSLEIYRHTTLDGTLFNTKYKSPFKDEVLSYIELNPRILEENHLIAIHYYELILALNNEEAIYQKLTLLKNKFGDKLDSFGKHNLYATLSAYCFIKIRNGDASYREEVLKLDVEILEKDAYGISDYIPYSYYHGIIRNAAMLKEFNWAYKFLQAYQHKLDPKTKEFAINYSKADIFLEQKEYDKALEHLSRISIDYEMEIQRIKNMKIKIYYESASYENAISLIDSSRHFLKNNENFRQASKKSFLDFLKYSSMLINAKLKPGEMRSDNLNEKIKKAEYFVNKEWILEKLTNKI